MTREEMGEESERTFQKVILAVSASPILCAANFVNHRPK